MKTLSILASFAAVAAVAFSTFSFELSVSLLFTVGFGAILAADYLNPRHARWHAVRRAAASPTSDPRRSAFRLAA